MDCTIRVALYQYCALNLKSGFQRHHQRTGDTAVASRCSPFDPQTVGSTAPRVRADMPSCAPVFSSSRARRIRATATVSSSPSAASRSRGHRARPLWTRPLPSQGALCIFLSGDAHESMSVTSVSDDARLAVRSLDDEWGERRRVLAKGDSEVLGFGDFVVRASFLLCRIPTDDTRHYAGVRV